MKNIICILLILSLCYGFCYSSLTIDTNELVLTNSNITNAEMTNVIEQELPNSFLKTGKIEYEAPETTGRRFDIVYFVSIPITYYLLFSLMIIKNQWASSGRQLDSTDYNYIYISTFIVPMAIAYYDLLYVDKQKKIRNQFACRQIEIPDIRINLLALRF